MIMAELKGPHVPRWVANGDFAVQPYIVMEHIAGPTLAAECSRPAPCGRRDRAHRRADGRRARRPAPAARAAPRSQARERPVPPGRRRGADRFRPVASRAAARSAGGAVPSADRNAPNTWRPSSCCASGPTSAATSSRLARSSISSRPGGFRSAFRRACARCAGASGATRSRRARCGPKSRQRCRRSFCAVSSRCPTPAMRAPRISCSSCAIRIWS